MSQNSLQDNEQATLPIKVSTKESKLLHFFHESAMANVTPEMLEEAINEKYHGLRFCQSSKKRRMECWIAARLKEWAQWVKSTTYTATKSHPFTVQGENYIVPLPNNINACFKLSSEHEIKKPSYSLRSIFNLIDKSFNHSHNCTYAPLSPELMSLLHFTVDFELVAKICQAVPIHKPGWESFALNFGGYGTQSHLTLKDMGLGKLVKNNSNTNGNASTDMTALIHPKRAHKRQRAIPMAHRWPFIFQFMCPKTLATKRLEVKIDPSISIEHFYSLALYLNDTYCLGLTPEDPLFRILTFKLRIWLNPFPMSYIKVLSVKFIHHLKGSTQLKTSLTPQSMKKGALQMALFPNQLLELLLSPEMDEEAAIVYGCFFSELNQAVLEANKEMDNLTEAIQQYCRDASSQIVAILEIIKVELTASIDNYNANSTHLEDVWEGDFTGWENNKNFRFFQKLSHPWFLFGFISNLNLISSGDSEMPSLFEKSLLDISRTIAQGNKIEKPLPSQIYCAGLFLALYRSSNRIENIKPYLEKMTIQQMPTFVKAIYMFMGETEDSQEARQLLQIVEASNFFGLLAERIQKQMQVTRCSPIKLSASYFPHRTMHTYDDNQSLNCERLEVSTLENTCAIITAFINFDPHMLTKNAAALDRILKAIFASITSFSFKFSVTFLGTFMEFVEVLMLKKTYESYPFVIEAITQLIENMFLSTQGILLLMLESSAESREHVSWLKTIADVVIDISVEKIVFESLFKLLANHQKTKESNTLSPQEKAVLLSIDSEKMAIGAIYLQAPMDIPESRSCPFQELIVKLACVGSISPLDYSLFQQSLTYPNLDETLERVFLKTLRTVDSQLAICMQNDNFFWVLTKPHNHYLYPEFTEVLQNVGVLTRLLIMKRASPSVKLQGRRHQFEPEYMTLMAKCLDIVSQVNRLNTESVYKQTEDFSLDSYLETYPYEACDSFVRGHKVFILPERFLMGRLTIKNQNSNRQIHTCLEVLLAESTQFYIADCQASRTLQERLQSRRRGVSMEEDAADAGPTVQNVTNQTKPSPILKIKLPSENTFPYETSISQNYPLTKLYCYPSYLLLKKTLKQARMNRKKNLKPTKQSLDGYYFTLSTVGEALSILMNTNGKNQGNSSLANVLLEMELEELSRGGQTYVRSPTFIEELLTASLEAVLQRQSSFIRNKVYSKVSISRIHAFDPTHDLITTPQSRLQFFSGYLLKKIQKLTINILGRLTNTFFKPANCAPNDGGSNRCPYRSFQNHVDQSSQTQPRIEANIPNQFGSEVFEATNNPPKLCTILHFSNLFRIFINSILMFIKNRQCSYQQEEECKDSPNWDQQQMVSEDAHSVSAFKLPDAGFPESQAPEILLKLVSCLPFFIKLQNPFEISFELYGNQITQTELISICEEGFYSLKNSLVNNLAGGAFWWAPTLAQVVLDGFQNIETSYLASFKDKLVKMISNEVRDQAFNLSSSSSSLSQEPPSSFIEPRQTDRPINSFIGRQKSRSKQEYFLESYKRRKVVLGPQTKSILLMDDWLGDLKAWLANLREDFLGEKVKPILKKNKWAASVSFKIPIQSDSHSPNQRPRVAINYDNKRTEAQSLGGILYSLGNLLYFLSRMVHEVHRTNHSIESIHSLLYNAVKSIKQLVSSLFVETFEKQINYAVQAMLTAVRAFCLFKKSIGVSQSVCFMSLRSKRPQPKHRSRQIKLQSKKLQAIGESSEDNLRNDPNSLTLQHSAKGKEKDNKLWNIVESTLLTILRLSNGNQRSSNSLPDQVSKNQHFLSRLTLCEIVTLISSNQGKDATVTGQFNPLTLIPDLLAAQQPILRTTIVDMRKTMNDLAVSFLDTEKQLNVDSQIWVKARVLQCYPYSSVNKPGVTGVTATSVDPLSERKPEKTIETKPANQTIHHEETQGEEQKNRKKISGLPLTYLPQDERSKNLFDNVAMIGKFLHVFEVYENKDHVIEEQPADTHQKEDRLEVSPASNIETINRNFASQTERATRNAEITQTIKTPEPKKNPEPKQGKPNLKAKFVPLTQSLLKQRIAHKRFIVFQPTTQPHKVLQGTNSEVEVWNYEPNQMTAGFIRVLATQLFAGMFKQADLFEELSSSVNGQNPEMETRQVFSARIILDCFQFLLFEAPSLQGYIAKMNVAPILIKEAQPYLKNKTFQNLFGSLVSLCGVTFEDNSQIAANSQIQNQKVQKTNNKQVELPFIFALLELSSFLRAPVRRQSETCGQLGSMKIFDASLIYTLCLDHYGYVLGKKTFESFDVAGKHYSSVGSMIRKHVLAWLNYRLTPNCKTTGRYDPSALVKAQSQYFKPQVQLKPFSTYEKLNVLFQLSQLIKMRSFSLLSRHLLRPKLLQQAVQFYSEVKKLCHNSPPSPLVREGLILFYLQPLEDLLAPPKLRKQRSLSRLPITPNQAYFARQTVKSSEKEERFDEERLFVRKWPFYGFKGMFDGTDNLENAQMRDDSDSLNSSSDSLNLDSNPFSESLSQLDMHFDQDQLSIDGHAQEASEQASSQHSSHDDAPSSSSFEQAERDLMLQNISRARSWNRLNADDQNRENLYNARIRQGSSPNEFFVDMQPDQEASFPLEDHVLEMNESFQSQSSKRREKLHLPQYFPVRFGVADKSEDAKYFVREYLDFRVFVQDDAASSPIRRQAQIIWEMNRNFLKPAKMSIEMEKVFNPINLLPAPYSPVVTLVSFLRMTSPSLQAMSVIYFNQFYSSKQYYDEGQSSLLDPKRDLEIVYDMVFESFQNNRSSTRSGYRFMRNPSAFRRRNGFRRPQTIEPIQFRPTISNQVSSQDLFMTPILSRNILQGERNQTEGNEQGEHQNNTINFQIQDENGNIQDIDDIDFSEDLPEELRNELALAIQQSMLANIQAPQNSDRISVQVSSRPRSRLGSRGNAIDIEIQIDQALANAGAAIMDQEEFSQHNQDQSPPSNFHLDFGNSHANSSQSESPSDSLSDSSSAFQAMENQVRHEVQPTEVVPQIDLPLPEISPPQLNPNQNRRHQQRTSKPKALKYIPSQLIAEIVSQRHLLLSLIRDLDEDDFPAFPIALLQVFTLENGAQKIVEMLVQEMEEPEIRTTRELEFRDSNRYVSESISQRTGPTLHKLKLLHCFYFLLSPACLSIKAITVCLFSRNLNSAPHHSFFERFIASGVKDSAIVKEVLVFRSFAKICFKALNELKSLRDLKQRITQDNRASMEIEKDNNEQQLHVSSQTHNLSIQPITQASQSDKTSSHYTLQLLPETIQSIRFCNASHAEHTMFLLYLGSVFQQHTNLTTFLNLMASSLKQENPYGNFCSQINFLLQLWRSYQPKIEYKDGSIQEKKNFLRAGIDRVLKFLPIMDLFMNGVNILQGQTELKTATQFKLIPRSAEQKILAIEMLLRIYLLLSEISHQQNSQTHEDCIVQSNPNTPRQNGGVTISISPMWRLKNSNSPSVTVKEVMLYGMDLSRLWVCTGLPEDVQAMVRSAISNVMTSEQESEAWHRKQRKQKVDKEFSIFNSPLFKLALSTPELITFSGKMKIFYEKLGKLIPDTQDQSVFVINRTEIFQDSYRLMTQLPRKKLLHPFRISFNDQEGEDAGGITREWYELLSEQMFNPNYALFERASTGSTYRPNVNSYVNPDHLLYYEFVGKVVGKALADRRLLNAYFTPSFYKHILGVPLAFSDLQLEDFQLYNSLQWILRTSPVEQYLGQTTFTQDFNNFGELVTRQLVPNGSTIHLCESNKHQYVQLLAYSRMADAVRPQLQCFLKGLYQVIPRNLLLLFTPKELETLISGLPDVNVNDLRMNTEYVNYTHRDPTIIHFWQILEQFDKPLRAAFLQFVTGTSRVPVEGFKGLRGSNDSQKFNIHRQFDVSRLPVAHTCFNQLDLPNYPTKDILKEKLLYAINEAKVGFSIR